MLTVRINNDPDCENPCVFSNWKLISFNRQHFNFNDGSEYICGINNDGDVIPENIGFRRKLDCGTAFVLSYYQHSSCEWSLKGEGWQCMWDTVGIAGLLIWEGKPKELGKNYSERQKHARDFLECYNNWSNGWTYAFTIEDKKGEIINSCSGYYGMESLLDEIRKEYNEELQVIHPSGDTQHIIQDSIKT